MEMLVAKFSKGKYKNELELFEEPISAENVKLMGEMIALQALRTVKKYDMKIADKLYIGLIKDLHHMNEIDYIVSDGYDCAQTAVCFLYQFVGHTVHEIYGKDKKGKDITIKLACYREVDRFIDTLRNRPDSHKQVEYIELHMLFSCNIENRTMSTKRQGIGHCKENQKRRIGIIAWRRKCNLPANSKTKRMAIRKSRALRVHEKTALWTTMTE